MEEAGDIGMPRAAAHPTPSPVPRRLADFTADPRVLVLAAMAVAVGSLGTLAA